MTLTELLQQDAAAMYGASESLMKMVEPNMLGWKPSTGNNWMTVGQLLRHMADACGAPTKGFVTGVWEMPGEMKPEDMAADQMLPPAEKLPAVASVDEAVKLLEQDKQVALRFIAAAGESNLLTRKMAAPWGGPELTLYQHLGTMIMHLGQHKGQLFYYLKLMGKDVNTMHLWGM